MSTLKFTGLVKQREIDLEDRDLSDGDLDAVVRVLKESKVLQDLYLDGNNLTLADEKFTDALANNRTLESLSLGVNKIGVDGAKHIANALKVNKTLKELRLYSNKIGVDGAKHLTNALKENESLEIICLKENNIGDEGAEHLADALKVNKTVKELLLNANKIGAGGAKHLADALEVNKTLKELRLCNNTIGDEGAKSIAACLYKNQHLTGVDLSLNNICDDGAKKLAEALGWNYGIKSLQIDCTPVSEHVKTEIKEVLKDPGRKVLNAQARHLHEVIVSKVLTLVASKDETIASKNHQIVAKDQELNSKDTRIEKKNGEIKSLKKAMAKIYKQKNSPKAAIRAPMDQLMKIIEPVDLIGKEPEPSNKRARTDDDGTARSNLAAMADHAPSKDGMKAVEASINDTRDIKVKKEADDTTYDIYNADTDDDNDGAENQEKNK